MLKRILLFSRRWVKMTKDHMFVFGAAFVVIIGVSILVGEWPTTDLSEYPRWLGQLCIYFGSFLMIVYFIDNVYRLIRPLFRRRKKGSRKPTTLFERIRRAELGEYKD